MPLYEFDCSVHGAFEEIRPMQQSREPASCPTCGQLAPRVLSATRIGRLSAAAISVHARNEKSQHSPEVRSGHVHGSACQHGQSRGLRAHRGSRPWVLEHA